MSATLYRLPRTFATPRNHGLVEGTLVNCGSGNTSPISARSTSQFRPAICTPRVETRSTEISFACNRSIRFCWNSRRLSRFDIGLTSKNSVLAEVPRKGAPGQYGQLREPNYPHPTRTGGDQSNTHENGADTV